MDQPYRTIFTALLLLPPATLLFAMMGMMVYGVRDLWRFGWVHRFLMLALAIGITLALRPLIDAMRHAPERMPSATQKGGE